MGWGTSKRMTKEEMLTKKKLKLLPIFKRIGFNWVPPTKGKGKS